MGVVTTNRQRVAYHEAGHAVVTLLLLGSPDHLHCVTNLKHGPHVPLPCVAIPKGECGSNRSVAHAMPACRGRWIEQ